jgi:hypothetical protein
LVTADGTLYIEEPLLSVVKACNLLSIPEPPGKERLRKGD